jgi:putative aminopeptidase FrvX
VEKGSTNIMSIQQEIADFIEQHGPRPAGSGAEKAAQDAVAQRMKKLGAEVKTEVFWTALNAKFGKLKFLAFFYCMCLLLHHYLPLLSFFIATVNSIVLLCDFMANIGIADFLFKQRASWNVSADLEPQDIPKQSIIITSHIDSAYEFTWWYKLGKHGGLATVLVSALIVLLPLVEASHLMALKLYAPFDVIDKYLWYLMILLSPTMIMFFTFYGKRVVPGAADNLSGTFIAMHLMEQLRDDRNNGKSKLQKTKLRFISLGAEERGVRGSKAYVHEHLQELKDMNAQVINIDTIRQMSALTLLKNEPMSMTIYDKNLLLSLKQSFDENGISVAMKPLPMGATDAVNFQSHGIPAASVIGLRSDQLDFTYHTRNDVAANLEEEAMQAVLNVLLYHIKKLDSRAI